MDLFCLPVEILEKIVIEFSVNDLLACTKVCKRWRSYINQNFIWKQKCLLYRYDYHLMERAKSQKLIEDEDSADEDENSLEPLCYWRQVFNWYRNLDGKWINGDFINYKLSETNSPVYCLHSDDEVIATGHEDASIHIWCVKGVPCHRNRLRALLSDYPILSIRMRKNVLIALQKKLLQIYHTKDNGITFKLVDAKSFELGADNMEQWERINRLATKYESWYKECLRMNEIYSTKSLVYNFNYSTLYVSTTENDGILWSWSIPENELFTCHKIFDENIRSIDCIEDLVYLTVGNDITYLLYLDKITDRFEIMLTVPGNKRFMIEEKLIVAIPSVGDNCMKRIWVWDKLDLFKRPKTRDILNAHHSITVALHKYIVYSENGQVKVWNTEQDIVISSFTISHTIGFIRSCFSTVIFVFDNYNSYLWNWKTGIKICRLGYNLEWIGDYRNLVHINPTLIISAGANKQLEIFNFL
ncbi:hypothetical protein O3M35_008041 [Rhynocoris fuscipes]|uniref:F-box domain-containing protein n=1 Tax=Rhynocoris fuscipes TaxID=488301 RepID=A0AAW1D4U1_9HEMI